eukprot:7340347-Prymnesium_polylepis.1
MAVRQRTTRRATVGRRARGAAYDAAWSASSGAAPLVSTCGRARRAGASLAGRAAALERAAAAGRPRRGPRRARRRAKPARDACRSHRRAPAARRHALCSP